MLKFFSNKNQLVSSLSQIFSLDLRSLALIRIIIGLLVLFDILMRLPDLEAFYINSGVYPSFINDYWWRFSIHSTFDSSEWQIVLFTLTGIAASFLLIGKYTRIATIATWFLIVSLHHRNGLILSRADDVLRLLLFWSMFLPLGSIWSLDSLKKNSSRRSYKVTSIATFGFIIQLINIYWSAFFLKTGSEWQVTYTAIYYALHIGRLQTDFGQILLNYPDYLKFLTFIILRFELWIPILFLFPIYKYRLRIFGIFVLIIMHAGFGLGLSLYIFPVVMITYLVGLLPTSFWDYLYNKLSIPFDLNNRKTVLDIPNISLRKILFQLPLFIVTIYICVWNFITIIWPNYKQPFIWKLPGQLLAIDQKWDVFAPSPLRLTFWIVIPAQTKNGSLVDIYSGKQNIDWQKPPDLANSFKNSRWSKYLENLVLDKSDPKYYSRYLCKSWNKDHAYGQHLTSIDIYVVSEIALLNNAYTSPTKKVLYSGDCI